MNIVIYILWRYILKANYCMALAVIFSSFGLTQTSYAQTASNDVMIIATPTTQSATTNGEKVFFSQTFDIAVANTGEADINLDDVCFIAHGDTGKTFNTDTIDEKLASGTLKPGEQVKGFVAFATSDKSVYDARIVKASKDCK